jgi:thiamine transport system permease protein
LKLYQLMGAYRMEDASAVAVVLLLLSLAVFWICDFWGKRHVDL